MSSARPFYYLENFCEALGWLQGRYADLLQPQELAFIDTIKMLPQAAAGLMVRLVMRRGELFRTSRIAYGEIGPTGDVLPVLVELAWIDPRPALSLKQLCALLRRDELQQALRLRRRPRPTCRAVRQLSFDFRDEEILPLEQWWREAPDQVLQVRVARLCQRLRLMFFGNFHQDWSAFVLSDLGIRRYETVALESASRAFETREQLDHFELLYELRTRLQDDASPREVLAAVPAALPECGLPESDWIESRRARLLFRIGQQSERSGDLEGAIAAYSRCPLAEARVRAVRALERAGQPREAIERLSEGERVSTTELERQHARRIRPRLMRKLGIPPVAQCCIPQAPAWNTFEIELPADDCGPAVEHRVRDHLQSVGAPVVYVENGLIASLFGLLFWKAIFAPVRGAFFHPFQAAPADLFEAGFLGRRREAIEACFALLDDGGYRATILANLEQKAGLAAPFVSWGLVSTELAHWTLECVPAAHLRALFTRLLSDLRTNRTGLPDLIQFWPGERRYRMIEVKGPGDRLQDNQVRWLEFCAGNGIAVEVCRVRWG